MSMSDRGNVELMRSAYESFAQGDVPAVLGLLHPDVEWTEAEGFPYGGTYRGPEAVLNGVFVRLGTEWEGFQVAPQEFLSDGKQVVVLGEYSGTYKQTGRSFRAPFAHVWELDGGRITRFRQYTDTALVQRALAGSL